jgi:hypothetical protein
MSFFTMDIRREGERETYSVDKLIHSIANHYNSDVLGSLHGTKQTKSSYLKIPLFQGCKINV